MRWELSASRLRPEENEVRRRCDLPGNRRAQQCLFGLNLGSFVFSRPPFVLRSAQQRDYGSF
jgi:hypothetical protein